MAHFVKWRGPFLAEGSPSISRTIQAAQVGQAYRFGIWGGAGLRVGPNDSSVAEINERAAVERSTNNITWYELVGRREANVMIEARNPGDNAVWDYFQLAVKKGTGKGRAPVHGINYDYSVDTRHVGENTNASLIVKLKVALIPVRAGTTVTDVGGSSFTAGNWAFSEWNNWQWKFKTVVERHWSEKFWLSAPATLTELEVPKKTGGKARVHLHCVLGIEFAPSATAHHRIQVVKSGAGPYGYRADSTHYDKDTTTTQPVSVTGFPQPFNTVAHEIGHTIGLHHACESITPSSPYCTAGHPDEAERMAKGGELRPRYATPWQNAAASWFNTNGHGHRLKPSDFTPYMFRIAPADV